MGIAMHVTRVSVLIGALLLTSGCATTEEGSSASPSTSDHSTFLAPDDTYDWEACASSAIFERGPGGAATRAAAVAGDLAFYQDLLDRNVSLEAAVSAKRYVELLTAAARALPDEEAGLRDFEMLIYEVVRDDGTPLGSIEVSASADGEYGITAINFAALSGECPTPSA